MFPDQHSPHSSDTSPLQRITTLAARTLSVPIAFITLLDGETGGRRIASIGAAVAVDDAPERYECLRVPFGPPDGSSVRGTLCAAALRPHLFSSDDLTTMSDLAALAESELTREQKQRPHEQDGRTYFALFMEHLPGTAYIKDAHGSYLFVNRKAAAAFGRPVADWLGRTDTDLWPAETASLFRDSDRAVLEHGQVFHSIDRIPHQDGAHEHISIKFPLCAPGGARLIGGITVDVTAQRRAEAALRATHDALQTLIASSPMAIIALNGEGELTLWNPAAERIFGWTEQEAIGRRYPLSEEDAHYLEECRTRCRQVIAGDAISGAESRRRRKDGRSIDIRFSAAPWQDAEGGTQVLSVLEDITARKQAEDELQESRARMDSILASLEDVVWSVDPESHALIYCSQALEQIYGRSLQEFLDNPHLQSDVVHPDDRAQHREEAVGFYASGKGNFEYRIVRPDGEVRWVNERCWAVRDSAGVVTRIDGVTTDITGRKQTEEAVRQAERNYRSIFENAVEGIFQTDAEGVCLRANPALARLCGYDSPAALIAGIRDMSTDLYVDPQRRAEFTRRIEADGAITEFESEIYRRDGSTMWISENARRVCDSEGRFLYYEGSVEDITHRKTQETERAGLLAEALERADRDPLTGLLNHRAFHKHLEQEADRALREGAPLAIAVMDLDNFKFFNDAYGHAVGDEVLRRVADALRHCCRSYDSLARFGGDEFAVLMPGLTGQDAASLAARLQDCARDIGYRPPGYDTVIPLGLSVGCAVFPEDGPGRLDALELADARLLRAKGGEADDKADFLRAELTQSRDGFSMLDALATAVDNKDRYTRRHSEDVLTYSLQIARELGLDAETQTTIQTAALLHDVGKIGVPDRILRKPGRLTPEEYQAIQHHATMGAIIVGAVPGFEETLDAIRHHHERWDGDGYPFGLRGEETPLIARLMAVADAFSAMTTDRPYRKGMPHEQALAMLEQGAGTQWDPKCVAAFLNARRGAATRAA